MRKRPRPIAAVVAVALWLVAAGPALAHKLKAFATAEGASVAGYAYFSPGGRAHQAMVTVTAPDGSIVARMPTDDEGNFRFEATRRIDHRISVDGGDGHVAGTTVTAAELPDSLPGGGDGDGAVAAPPAVPAADGPATATTLRALIDQSVSRQIRPLREQIDAYQEKVWMHDVLGGLGVIFGLGGLAYGLAERRRRTSPVQGANP